jgi:Chitobiase/beta-hexosaminidase C-terminal domain/Bacterial Ig-like domain
MRAPYRYIQRRKPTGAAVRAGARKHPMRGPLRCILVLLLAITAVTVIPIGTALAATGELYMLQATDPHGNVWLPGTTDGTTTGPLDPGTDPTSAGYGHLWTTDVTSGFCRIIPTTFNADGTVNTPAFLDRNTPGGCITAGGKPGQMELDPRRNADGTLYVYTPDWAVRSSGVYRLTFDPGKQIMTKSELLAPNRFPIGPSGQGVKPFDVQLGPGDRKLYVSNDINSSIDRITGVNGPIAQQTVETNIAVSNDGKRVRALTFVCWSNLATLNGGRGATRAPGAQGCSPQDPAPDLLLSQFNTVSVVLNAEDCQSQLGACVGVPTNIKVLTPMGLRTDPKDPTVVYISDSPGADSQIVRYHITTDIQDSYANFGILDDGTVARFSFAFSVGFGPDHAMYVGDDPSAGATAFNGRYFRVAPNAPADTLGQPGVPGNPPPPPSVQTGSLYATGVTLPSDGVWMGTHLWIADPASGLCRLDAAPGGSTTLENVNTCMINTNAAGLAKPEQSVFDAAKNLLYVSDGSSKSLGVVRFTFDPTGTVCTNPDGTRVGAAETLCGSGDSIFANRPQIVAGGQSGTGFGIDGQRADAVALDPLTDTLYVGFRSRNVSKTGATQIARVRNASATDTFSQSVEFVAKTTRDVPVFGLGIIVNPATTDAPATSDLYIGDNKGVDVLYNVGACAPGECMSMLLLNVRGPHGFAVFDGGPGNQSLYMAGPPAPNTGNNTTVVQQYTISTGDLFAYSSVGVNPDGTQQQYAFVNSLAINPNTGDLYVGDNRDAVAPPNGVGHIWKVTPPGAGAGPSQPTITVKPGNPTNNPTPSFAFSTLTSGATLSCSLVASGTADSFAPCTSPFVPAAPLADGAYTFKVESVSGNSLSAPAIYSFTVDTAPPVVTLAPQAKNPTNVNTPSFTFSATKNGAPYTGMAYQCSFTTGADAFTACGSPQTYAARPDGAYTFKVQGTDLAGNVSAVASSTLTIDTAAPTVAASPAGGSYATAQSVTLTATDVTAVTITYTTDGSSPLTSATKRTYTGPITVAATTTLRYVAVDAAGNQSPITSQAYTISTGAAPPAPLPPALREPAPSAPPAPGAPVPNPVPAPRP